MVFSADEARLIASMAIFSTQDETQIKAQLGSWLPVASVERLVARSVEFQNIVVRLGAVVPLRDWDMEELTNRADLPRNCQHVNEPVMFH